MTVVRLLRAEWSERPVTLRLPFQFGSTEVRSTAEAYCRVTALIGGREVQGRSAQLMVPRWFDKRPGLSNDDTIDALRASVAGACRLCPGLTGRAVSVSRDLRAQVAGALPPGSPALSAGFGPALVEMALIDAICRARGQAFWQAAAGDAFGLLEACPPDLPKAALDATLATIAAPRTVTLRHTIGFDAPLTPDAVGEDAPRDGLPVALSEVIEATGITAFKIKLKGAPEADLARLRAIAGLLDRGAGYSATLDANEQYTADAFRGLLSGLAADPALARLRDAVRFFEQPLAREDVFDSIGTVDFGVPVVIDESDDTEDAFARALTLGWAGTSVKSCKGVLRALFNMARARAAGAILTAEDLTCQPGLCWQQDTAMAAACGVRDIERNGHHFAGGMQGAPPGEVAALLKAHPDIYRPQGSTAALRIEAGRVDVGSLGLAGFGRAGSDQPVPGGSD